MPKQFTLTVSAPSLEELIEKVERELVQLNFDLDEHMDYLPNPDQVRRSRPVYRGPLNNARQMLDALAGDAEGKWRVLPRQLNTIRCYLNRELKVVGLTQKDLVAHGSVQAAIKAKREERRAAR